MGGIERGTLAEGNSRQNFDTFFKRLGDVPTQYLAIPKASVVKQRP